MGSACCIAARDKTIPNGSGSEILVRSIRYSPTWSFRWDNRRRVVGEETSLSWLSDGISRNERSDIKYESAFASEEESPLESFRARTPHKSPVSERISGHLRTPASDQSVSRNTSMDVNMEQVKESADSLEVSYPSSTKLSLSLPSTSSMSMSPLSSQSQLQSANPTTSRWAWCSPGRHLSHQLPDNQNSGPKSPNRYSITEDRRIIPSWSNDSTRGSRDGSSDGWSMQTFSELMASSHTQSKSIDTESYGFQHEKISKYHNRISASRSIDQETCGVCSKLLSDKSVRSSQKIVATIDLSVVAVLTCGHVYHAECLEHMTPEIDKYDPVCPVCTLGEKKTVKLSEKALRAERDLKAKNNKRSKNRIVDSDLDGNSIKFCPTKNNGHEGKGPKMGSSSSMKHSPRRPFLWRHFSFGSKESRSPSDNHATRKRGSLAAKSSKM